MLDTAPCTSSKDETWMESIGHGQPSPSTSSCVQKSPCPPPRQRLQRRNTGPLACQVRGCRGAMTSFRHLRSVSKCTSVPQGECENRRCLCWDTIHYRAHKIFRSNCALSALWIELTQPDDVIQQIIDEGIPSDAIFWSICATHFVKDCTYPLIGLNISKERINAILSKYMLKMPPTFATMDLDDFSLGDPDPSYFWVKKLLSVIRDPLENIPAYLKATDCYFVEKKYTHVEPKGRRGRNKKSVDKEILEEKTNAEKPTTAEETSPVVAVTEEKEDANDNLPANCCHQKSTAIALLNQLESQASSLHAQLVSLTSIFGIRRPVKITLFDRRRKFNDRGEGFPEKACFVNLANDLDSIKRSIQKMAQDHAPEQLEPYQKDTTSTVEPIGNRDIDYNELFPSKRVKIEEDGSDVQTVMDCKAS